MPRIAIFFRWLFRIETVNIFEAGGRGIEPFAVEINVAVVADAHMFAALSDEALNVMRLLNQAWNMIRVKDNNVAPARRLEIVDKAVHEKVIATDCLEFDELLSFPNHLAVDQSGPLPQILNGKPKRIRLVSDPQGLFPDESQDPLHFSNPEFAGLLRHLVVVMNSRPARLKQFLQAGRAFHVRPAEEIL